LDKDQDGKVSKDEVIGSEPEDKKAEAEQRFTKYDKDKNGIVSLEEFVNQGL
jgi:Ca2+-binding EF-hand superfamily protein